MRGKHLRTKELLRRYNTLIAEVRELRKKDWAQTQYYEERRRELEQRYYWPFFKRLKYLFFPIK